MQKLGMEVPLGDITAIIAKHDLTKDGMISFVEFKKIFETEINTAKPFGKEGPSMGKAVWNINNTNALSSIRIQFISKVQ